MIIFIKTEKGRRTHIKSDFILLTKDKFQDDIQFDSSVNRYWINYRFSYLNSNIGSKSISKMTLEEYEIEFGSISLSKDVINNFFSKAIKEKYGK